MQPRKRIWIYLGMTVPDGVALARNQGHGKRARSVLLVGDEHAERLFAPLAKLVVASGGALHVDARRGTSLRDLVHGGRLRSHLGVFEPEVVMVASGSGAGDMLARRVVTNTVRSARARLVWIDPPGSERTQRAGMVVVDRSSVSGYAAAAAKAWMAATSPTGQTAEAG